MGIQKAIASDDGGEFKGRFEQILDAEDIDHTVMPTHLSFSDRFTRKIKNMLFESVQHTGKEWRLSLPTVIRQYKSTIHDSTKLRPVDAMQDKKQQTLKQI